jgi:hypothetical protein
VFEHRAGADGRVLRTAAHRLHVDAYTAEVVEALRGDDVPALLLKGPVIVEALYGTQARPYQDADLLVSPHAFDAAGVVLARLGFVQVLTQRDLPQLLHADIWKRRADGAVVDLHNTLPGVHRFRVEHWNRLWAERTTVAIGGGAVDGLGQTGVALLVALHASHHGVASDKPLTDLARALERFDLDVWRAAAAFADELQALPAFTAGLELLPAGRAVRASLDIPPADSLRVALLARSEPTAAVGLLDLAAARGIRAKSSFLARKLVPSARFMRVTSPLARRGRVGLVLAYACRPLRLLVEIAPALRALRRTSKDIGRR